MSPYEVVTGMKPNQARMWLHGESEKITEEEIQHYIAIKKERVEHIWKYAIEAIESRQKDFLEIQSNKKSPYVFKVGMKVLL